MISQVQSICNASDIMEVLATPGDITACVNSRVGVGGSHRNSTKFSNMTHYSLSNITDVLGNKTLLPHG